MHDARLRQAEGLRGLLHPVDLRNLPAEARVQAAACAGGEPMRLADIMADRLLEWAGEHRMSVRQMANRAGLPESTVYMVTSRRGCLSAANMRKLCATHGIDANWLLGLEEEC